MSKILYTCAFCGTHFYEKPESGNSHPHNVCQCGEVLDRSYKYRAELVSDDYWYGLPKIYLQPNWLK